MLSVLTQPCAILRGDKGAKPRETWMVRRSRREIGENLPQSQPRHRPVVRALPQHQPRVPDRPAHDFIYERVVHRGARCLSVGGNTEQAVANAAPLTSWGERPDLAQGAYRRPEAMGGRARIERVNLGPEPPFTAQSRTRQPPDRVTRGRAGCSQVARLAAQAESGLLRQRRRQGGISRQRRPRGGRRSPVAG